MKHCVPMLALILSSSLAFAAEEAKPIDLFNGKDMEGFKFVLKDAKADPASVWSVSGGVVRCTGTIPGYFRTTTRYSNYKLTFEWRFTGEDGNSGCLVHVQEPDQVWPKSIEAQGLYMNAGDLWVIGGADFKEHTNKTDRRVPKREASSEKLLGQWNSYEVLCKGNTIEVRVNGVLQNVATECTLSEGYIAWQSEGVPTEFRNLKLQPLGDTE